MPMDIYIKTDGIWNLVDIISRTKITYPENKLIKFTIEDKNASMIKEYQAVFGMTWKEWIESEYTNTTPSTNTSFTINNDVVYANTVISPKYIVTNTNGVYCYSSNKIIENEAYYCTGEK